MAHVGDERHDPVARQLVHQRVHLVGDHLGAARAQQLGIGASDTNSANSLPRIALDYPSVDGQHLGRWPADAQTLGWPTPPQLYSSWAFRLGVAGSRTSVFGKSSTKLPEGSDTIA